MRPETVGSTPATAVATRVWRTRATFAMGRWRRTSGFRAAMILREADEALGRTYDPTRLDAWYGLWRGSLWEQDPRSGQNGPGEEPADGPD